MDLNDEEDILDDAWLLSDSDDEESLSFELSSHETNVLEGPNNNQVGPRNGNVTENLVHVATPSATLSNESTTRQPPAVAEIERIFHHLEQSLTNGNQLSLPISARTRGNRGTVEANASEASRRHVRFPGRTAREGWKFTALLKVLELIHESLINDVVISKRDIFYRDPDLFVRQAVVDRMVDDISASFNLPRASLNVVAAWKGLVSGQIKIHRMNGSDINASRDHEGQLIPSLDDTDVVDSLSAKWILVIEKEAIFRGLVSSEHSSSLLQQGIIVTGKGYPDMATRLLLRRLAWPLFHDRGRAPPILGLVDYDPDGISILSTYKHGSESLRHANHLLQVPNIRWLGLRSNDVFAASVFAQRSNLVTLSPRDRGKATKMLRKYEFQEARQDAERWRRELQIMLMLNVKAEIELLEELSGGTARWLSERLSSI